MDIHKLREWIELSQSYQSEQFWKQVFSQNNRNANQHSNHQGTEQVQQAAEWPIYDMYLYGHTIYITMELPGIQREEIQLTLQDKTLIINGIFKTLAEGIHYYVKEKAPSEVFT
jgi:HSP20 family protein